MPSIRKRLMAVLATGFSLLIIGAGMALAGVFEARVTEEFDAALLAKARALVALTEDEDGHIQLDYEPAAFPEFERAESPDYFTFWLDDGRLLLGSSRLKGALPRRTPSSREPRVADVDLPDGRPGRLVQIDFVPAFGLDLGEVDDGSFPPPTVGASTERRGLTLVVARGRERLDGLIAGIRIAVVVVGVLATALAALLVWRALARGLAPVDRIATQVEGLDADRLDTRVDLPGTPRELAPIVAQLNALLERLNRSFERERRFAGNVAHELRTPIAELRALSEVGRRWPGDEASVARFFTDVEAVAGRMERVVADLLLLARCQAGIETVEHAAVGLRDALDQAWRRQAVGESAPSLANDVPADLVLESDPGKLGLIFANVLGNAIAYCRPGGTVRCRAEHGAGRFALVVSNPAAPLAPGELEKLTEPFWRQDAARAAAEHAGLGLSVVSELAALLSLRVRFTQDTDGLFSVRLEGAAREEASRVPRPVGAP